MSKIVLITGSTAGIGRETALHLARLGHHVIATGRRSAELARLKREAGSARLDTLLLDVTSLPSITSAVAAVDALTSGHGIDVLVNNAGFGVLGPTSEVSDAELRRQYDTNVFGLMNVTRAFLPRMVERRSGRVINVSSVGGRITLPYFGAYNSTKYAVESLSDAMRYELRPFGVDVVLIEPGVIRTNFEATAVASLDTFANTPYGAAVAKYDQLSRLADRFASNPIVIAKAIARAIKARRPAARYVAPFSTNAVILLSRVVPTRMWDWAMRRVGFLTPRALGVAATAASHHADFAVRATEPVPEPSRVAAN
jgi:NAD(P)-dependent dehydrogenase (short-subunit alcohol dehydrogenase family)